MAAECVINPDRLQNFFNELEARKTLLNSITDLHKTLTEHFTSLEQSLAQKSEALDSQFRALKDRAENALEAVQNRENAIPEWESTLAATVEERQASAIEEIQSSEGLGEKGTGEILRVYCRRMDAGRLLKFLLARRKESATLKAEIAAAVETVTVDPMRLVLDAVEEFVGMKVEGKAGMADRRWACGMLIQAVLPILSAGEIGVGVGKGLREKAVGVLEKWKGVLGGAEISGGVGANEASMFLQMVIGFGLKDKFEESFLRKLVMEFAARRDMAKLAVSLGFGEKMGDIIDELVKSGKEIEAVYFASESGLTEQFSPITLLKSCLRNCRRNAGNTSKNGNYNIPAVEKANNIELDTIKAIIKCVEDHKLESQFTTESLRKRVSQLEKAKADKKKSAASISKPSNKRAHGGSGRGGSSGPPSYRPPKAGRFTNASPSFRSKNPPLTHQTPAARFSAPYNYPNQRLYEGPSSTASYGPGYGGTHTQSPAALPQQYALTHQDVGPGGVRTGGSSYGGQGSYGVQSNYNAYDYGGASAPTYPPSYPQ